MQIGEVDPLFLGQQAGADRADLKALQLGHCSYGLAVTISLITMAPVIHSTAGDSDLTCSSGDRPATLPQLHKPCTLSRQRATSRHILNSMR